VIFTDSKDEVYKSAILQQLTSRFGGRRRVLYGDPILHDANLDKINKGPLLFVASLLVRRQAAAELMMDRTHCRACDTPCMAPCRGKSWEEYIVSQQGLVTDAADSLSTFAFTEDWPKPSCPASFVDTWGLQGKTGFLGAEVHDMSQSDMLKKAIYEEFKAAAGIKGYPDWEDRPALQAWTHWVHENAAILGFGDDWNETKMFTHSRLVS